MEPPPALVAALAAEAHTHRLAVAELIKANAENVTLLVGPDRIEIQVYKYPLAYFSKFFDSLLHGPFMEANAKEISLPQDDPEQIQIFVDWVKTGRLLLSGGDRRGGVYPKCDQDWSLRCPAVDLWVTADRLIAPKYENVIMNSFLNFLEAAPSGIRNTRLPASTVRFVYDNTFDNSKLRTFIKDMVTHKSPFGLIGYAPGTLQRQEWVDLCVERSDLIKDAIEKFNMEGPAHNRPYHSQNRRKYMSDADNISVEDWVKDLLRRAN